MNKLKVWWGLDYSYSLKLKPQRREELLLTISSRHHANQVITVNMISSGTNRNCMPPGSTQWEKHHSVIFLPKVYNPDLIWGNIRQTHSGGHSTSNGPGVSYAKVMEIKKDLSNYSFLKKTERDMTTKCSARF